VILNDLMGIQTKHTKTQR